VFVLGAVIAALVFRRRTEPEPDATPDAAEPTGTEPVAVH